MPFLYSHIVQYDAVEMVFIIVQGALWKFVLFNSNGLFANTWNGNIVSISYFQYCFFKIWMKKDIQESSSSV